MLYFFVRLILDKRTEQGLIPRLLQYFLSMPKTRTEVGEEMETDTSKITQQSSL